MSITLKDGSILECEDGIAVKEDAARISEGLAGDAVGAKVDGKGVEL